MTEKEARNAVSKGRKIQITAGDDLAFRGTATRVFTVNREHWMHVKSRSGKTGYALLADVALV